MNFGQLSFHSFKHFKNYRSEGINVLFICFFVLLCNSCKTRIKERKPNVVVILVDDLGWTDLGCYGSDFYQTPNIDQLASESFKFTNSYSSCTVCSPSRASIMTGKYPAKLDLTDWIEGHKYPWAKLNVPNWKMYLDSSETTMAEAFKNSGYTTAHVGKWHLGEQEKDWPENHGFDTNIAGWAKGSPQKIKEKGYNGYFSPYGNPRIEDGNKDEYLTERLTDEVCNLIEQNKSKPFFINFWLYNVHMPLQAKEDKIKKYEALVNSSNRHQNPIYAAMLEHTDESIGKVIEKLKEEGLYENTIILFSSDNGGLIGKPENRITNNYPLRHGKGNIYEGSVRIPTLLYSPFSKTQGRVIDEPIISNDYYPTLADLAGVAFPKKQKAVIDGVSWLPFLEGKEEIVHEALYWHYPHYHQEGAVPHSAIRMGDWKLYENFETQQYELYNLATDIGETINLSEKYPNHVKTLAKKLTIWRSHIKAQLPSKNPLFNPSKERQKG